MTSKERLFNRLEGKAVDRIPNLSIIMMFSAYYTGHKFGAFCTDYHVMVDSVLKTTKDFGLDILSTMSDAYRETYDYGATIVFPEDNLPLLKSHVIEKIEDAAKLTLWDPMQSTRVLDRINAVRLFKEKAGDEYAILGWVEGPWAEFSDLTGLTEAMYMIVEDPDEVQKAMEILTEQSIINALAQIEAGADVIGIGDAAASLISADMYSEYVLPLEQKLIRAIHDAGAKTKLHICGNINHFLAEIMETGSDIIDIDYMVNIDEAVKIANGRCSLCGQINPAKTILMGTVEDVKAETRYAATHGDSKFIVSSGCEVPKMTPIENFKAIDEELWALAKK